MSDATIMLAGRYRLDSRIAVGGMAEVWRATDEVLNLPVAVKLLRAEYAQYPDTLTRFRSEGRHAGSLSHPGIARVYDYGEDTAGAAEPKLAYLVMELVDGQSLTEVLGCGPLAPGRAMDVVAQVAAGLDAAHRAGLVHRDIKPGNLLLGPDGQVKITDFGISHAVGSAPITVSGALLGTPAYLAPERVAGKEATPASDLYSLGIVAWECLAGRPPFAGAPVEVAVAHRDRPVPSLAGAVPADVAVLIAELTAKDPRARPRSAAEVARRASQLRDALNIRSTLPLDTRLDLPSPGPARPGPRRRGRMLSGKTAALSAGGLLAAVMAGILLSGVPGHDGPQAPTASPSAAARPSALPARAVEVSASSLVGQQVSEVQAQLRQLGLGVRVIRQPSDQNPGTVLSVQPSGQVPAGSVIAVTAAGPTRHGRHDHGDGPGHRNGQGNGDGGD
jgi:eukaryotic-like serine/threonine-protein kinase